MYYCFATQGHIECQAGSDVLAEEARDSGIIAAMEPDSNSSSMIQAQSSMASSSAVSAAQQRLRSAYYLILSDPLPHDIVQAKRGVVDIILAGDGIRGHILARLSTRFQKKTVSLDSTAFYYGVNVNVKKGGDYTLYLPRVI